jgi:hypothetical protein
MGRSPSTPSSSRTPSAKKARALDKLAASLSSLRLSQGGGSPGDNAPGCVSPRGLFKPPSFRRDDAAAGAASPRQPPKWPRWMALNQGSAGSWVGHGCYVMRDLCPQANGSDTSVSE